MSEQYPGGFITKSPPTPQGDQSDSSAYGIWNLSQQAAYQAQGLWPDPTNVPSDPQFNYVTMLLHGDGTNGAQNNTFTDSSTNNFTITRNGNTTQGSFSPYGDNWSNYFNGSAYISVPDNAAFDVGAGEFCMEAWVFVASASVSDMAIFGQVAVSSGAGSYMLWTTSGYPAFYCTTGGSTATRTDTNSSVALTAKTWNHIAVCRSGTTLSLFLNGTRTATQTYSSTIYNGTSEFRIGGSIGSGYLATGYISNVRVVKGSSPYDATQSTITVPTSALTAISGTSLLTCQSNRFKDASSNNFAVTVASATVERFNPFGTSTAYSTATIGGSGNFAVDGDYLTVSTGVSIGSSESFTAEAWVYPTRAYTGDQQNVFGGGNGTNTQIYHSLGADGNIGAYLDGGSLASSSGYVKRNSWNHLVWCREGSTLRLFVNGVLAASGTVTNACAITFVGYPGGLGPLGYISGARVLKGVALYTAAFTPPTTPPTAISGTQLLCNFTNAGIYDNAMMNDLVTVGNAQISTSVVKYGTGSLAFDGTGDWLAFPVTPQWSLGTGDFTVEMWVNFASSTRTMVLVGNGGYNSTSSNVAGWSVGFNTGGAYFGFNTGTTSNWFINNDTGLIASTFPSNTWIHVAVTRQSGSLKCFINGIQLGSTISASGDCSTTSYVPKVGTDVSTSSGYYLNGYIDDLRITKGYARYTTTFTPPTQAFPNTGPN